MIVFANAKVATQQIKAAIEGALKLGMEMDAFITRAWESDSDMPSTFFTIIHNFRNDVGFFTTPFALVPRFALPRRGVLRAAE
jgi:hypothetical protein